jgi:hypothetical protein
MEAAVTKGGWQVLGGRLTGVKYRALMLEPAVPLGRCDGRPSFS